MERDERRPRRRPRWMLWRGVLEIASVAVLAIVLFALVGLVIHAGRGESAPPVNTFVVAQTQDFASLDPALAQTPEAWQLEYATCAKLLDYPRSAGYRGTRLEPEVATSLPKISADHLTYTLTIRKGWRFSNGEPVTAAAFAHALERARSAELVSPALGYLREVAGWSAHGRVLTIRLRSPAPDFAQRLALPYFCAVPTWAPMQQDDTLPSAGPFAIASYEPGRSLTLVRNRYYHGPERPHVQRIVYRFGALPSEVLLQLERGEIDYGVVSATAFAQLQQKFGSDTKHLFVAREPTVAYLALNTTRRLFHDNPQLRRAVAYAIDRPALVRLFGPHGAEPTDEYLPPGLPGYQPAHVYPLDGPDVRKARALAAGHLRGGTATFLACGTQDCANRAIVVAQALRRIGLRVKIVSSFGAYTLASVRGTKFDITDVITRPDYGDPYGLLDKLLDGRVIQSVGNSNLAYYASPAINRQIDAAQRLSGLARAKAYGRLGVAVARTDAPLVAYAVLNARVYVSSRVGCVTYQPVYGLDLAGVCLTHPTT